MGSNQLCSDLFNEDTECLIPTTASEASTPCHNNSTMTSSKPIGQRLASHQQQQQQQQHCQNLGRRFSAQQNTKLLGGSLLLLPQPQLEPGVFRSLNYPAFQSLRIERVISIVH